MAKSPQAHKSPKASEASTKGKLVEIIVAELHKQPGVEVELNVRVRPKHGSQKRRREIDVLVQTQAAGYPVKIAIECKNYKKVIGVGLIDEFRGKLEEADIPTQHGVYITTQRFTKDALDRAKILGINPLLLTGLSNDRITSEILTSVSSVIYLLSQLSGFRIKTEKGEFTPLSPGMNFLAFCDANGELNGSVIHEFWLNWINSNLLEEVGDHIGQLQLYSDFFILNKGELEKVVSIDVSYRVAAQLVDFEGTAMLHGLWNQPQDTLSRFAAKASFPPPTGSKTVRTFNTEGLLHDYLSALPHKVKMAQRFKLPRIWFDWFYWPPSDRMEKILSQRMEDFVSGKIATFPPEDQNEYEGTDLSTVWEPITPKLFENYSPPQNEQVKPESP